MLQPWLELNRTDRRRAPDIENIDCPRLDSRSVHDRSHLLGEVVHVAGIYETQYCRQAPVAFDA